MTSLAGLWLMIPAFLKKAVIISGVSAVVLLGTYWKGRADCSAIHDALAAKAEIARLNKIVSDTAAVAEADRKKAEEAAQRSSELETIIESLSAHAKTLNGACLSAPDAERLRQLWK